tara:strand:+ start:65 stop:274 length:210 start_codon:yes stop_codon:yes gene_type:complete
MEKYLDQDYADGWRYIVWVGGNDDYYKNYNDAKRDADEWIAKGYDDVIIEEIQESNTTFIDINDTGGKW